MGKLVEPRVFFVGYTTMDRAGMEDYLSATGNEEFAESIKSARDAGLSDGEILCSFYAKLCYKSLTLGHNANITRTRDITDNLRGCFDQGHGSVFEHCQLNFVITDCSRVLTHELVRHRVGTAFCLAGDVVVWSGSKVNGRWDGVRKKWTMKQLHDWSGDPSRKGRLKLIKVRCLTDDGEFVPAPLAGITKSGVKDIVKVTMEDGRSIRCSADHRFLRPSGWSSISEMLVGDRLAMNGRRTGVAADPVMEVERRRKIAASKIGSLNHQWRGDEVGDSGARRRARMAVPREQCDECGGSQLLSVHHIDRNIRNNAAGNLRTLCSPCHARLHNDEDGNPNALVPEWVRIASIVSDGREMTYDIEVGHDAHNFVANGFVTHNSQTSGRYVRGDAIDVVFDPILEPVRDQVETLQMVIEQSYARMVCTMGLDQMTDFFKKKKITSALRRLLPNGQSNEIGFSVNLRSLRHTVTVRTSRHAEWEIRHVFGQIYRLVKERYPLVFHGAVEEEVDGLIEVSGMKLQP